MKRRSLLLSLAILMLIVSSGCWSRIELNRLAIVVGMAIDVVEDGQFKVTLQVVEPEQVASQKGSGGGRAPVSTFETKAPNIAEALRKVTVDVPRKIFPSHQFVLIFGEKIAKQGVSEVLEHMTRSNEFRNDFYILIAKEVQGADILTVSTELEKLPSNKLYDSMQTSEKEWGSTKIVTLAELVNELTIEGISPVLTGIKLIGDVEHGKTRENVDAVKSPTYFTFSGLGVIDEGRLVGWLDEEESRGYNFIIGNISSSVQQSPCSEEGHIVVHTERARAKMKAKVNNDQPSIDVQVYGNAQIVEVTCPIDLNHAESIARLESEINKTIEGLMTKALKAAQKFEADIFSFGKAIERKDPKFWRKVSSDWEQHFVELPVTFQANYKIRNTGTQFNSYLRDQKKNNEKEGD